MEARTILVPSRIGPYVFKGTAGSGAFSVVKVVFNEELNEFFACKIVSRGSLNIDDLDAKFELETRINQQIHHSGIVRIVDLLKDNRNYYIFMEFCPNGELFDYIGNVGKLCEEEAAVIIRQLLDAMAYVHGLGIAHRDLKPENILLDVNGAVKVSDFGLSRFVGRGGLVETGCGSPYYVSPECISGKPYDGRKSDMWSLGVISFAIVAGILPWTHRPENQIQLFRQIMAADYVLPPWLSANCKDFVQRLLVVDTTKRMTAAEALKHPFLTEEVEKKQFPVNVMQLVSLKKVDDFFSGNDVMNAAAVDETEIASSPSQKGLTFGGVRRVMNVKDSILRRRPVMVTMSVQEQPGQPVAGAEYGSKIISSVGKLPQPVGRSMVMQPRRQVIAPKVRGWTYVK